MCPRQPSRSIAASTSAAEWALLGEAPRAGDEYDGERDAQQRYHGKGVLRRANFPGHCVGECQGSFFRGRYHGMGRRKPVISYIGQCFLGTAHGKGTLIYSSLPDSYTGEFAADLPHGQGVWLRRDDARLEGQIASPPHRLGAVLAEHTANEGESRDHFDYMCHLCVNSVNGLGVCTVPGGGQAAGEWRRGQFHGYGVSALPDGRRVEGRWIKGNIVASESRGMPCVALWRLS